MTTTTTIFLGCDSIEINLVFNYYYTSLHQLVMALLLKIDPFEDSGPEIFPLPKSEKGVRERPLEPFARGGYLCIG